MTKAENEQPVATYLAVDAGGSNTVAWLGESLPSQPSAMPRVVGRGRGGPANLRRAGVSAVVKVIKAAVDDAFEDAGRAPHAVSVACCGVAGAGHEAIQKELAERLRQARFADEVDVTHDAEPLLEFTTTPGTGVALIAGTGSMVYGRNQQGETVRAGGWGYLAGDPGSGFAIGLDALRELFASVDHRRPLPDWSAAILEHFTAASIDRLVDILYAGAPDVRRIAQAAPIVLRAAVRGDRAAVAIVDRQADELAEQIQIAVHHMAFPFGKYELVMTGGLLVGCESYRQRVQEILDRRSVGPVAVHIASHPVDGAMRRASRLECLRRSQ